MFHMKYKNLECAAHTILGIEQMIAIYKKVGILGTIHVDFYVILIQKSQISNKKSFNNSSSLYKLRNSNTLILNWELINNNSV